MSHDCCIFTVCCPWTLFMGVDKEWRGTWGKFPLLDILKNNVGKMLHIDPIGKSSIRDFFKQDAPVQLIKKAVWLIGSRGRYEMIYVDTCVGVGFRWRQCESVPVCSRGERPLKQQPTVASCWVPPTEKQKKCQVRVLKITQSGTV